MVTPLATYVPHTGARAHTPDSRSMKPCLHADSQDVLTGWVRLMAPRSLSQVVRARWEFNPPSTLDIYRLACTPAHTWIHNHLDRCS